MRISDWSSDVCSSDLSACGLWITPDPSVCACDKDSSTASWGLRPRRLAAFGRPGSLKRSSHPASPMRWSRLRRPTFVCLGMIAIVALDRIRVGYGRIGLGLVDLGGLLIIKKKKTT